VDSKTRYLIIALLVVIFMVLAPLLVFYVTGRTLPFFTAKPSDTGILDVQSIPSGAQVYVDEESAGSTPATVRFLRQGWHEVKIQETNFRPWIKKLFVQAGEVTYAGTIDDAVRLLPDAPAIPIAEQIVTTEIVGDNLILATASQVQVYDLGKQTVVRSANTPVQITQLKPTQRGNLVFAKFNSGEWALLNTNDLIFTKLPSAIAAGDQVELLGESTVFGRKQNTLHIAAVGSTQGQIALEGISGFTTHDNLVYITTTAGAGELATYYWDNTQLIKQTILLSSGLPQNTILQLYLTNQKELFVLAGDSLYRVNQTLELVKNSVLNVNFNFAGQRLTFFTPTEIYFYNFGSGQAELLARTTNNLAAADVVPAFGYGFIADQTGSEAIEIDSRGNQNRYQMIPQGPASDLLIAPDESELILLANQTVYTVRINK
jgi:hypothetical protein